MERPRSCKRFFAALLRLGFQSSKEVSSVALKEGSAAPDAYPPPIPIMPPKPVPMPPRPAPIPADCVPAFEEFEPMTRATRKARSKSSICVTMTSSADFSIGGSAKRKNDAALMYCFFRSKLYAFFSAAFLPRGEEKSCSVMNFKNVLPLIDWSVAAKVLSLLLFPVAIK
jgi:hypothetical protein